MNRGEGKLLWARAHAKVHVHVCVRRVCAAFETHRSAAIAFTLRISAHAPPSLLKKKKLEPQGGDPTSSSKLKIKTDTQKEIVGAEQEQKKESSEISRKELIQRLCEGRGGGTDRGREERRLLSENAVRLRPPRGFAV